ncbi:MAG: hypothetical protein FJY85_26030, partial [Deltaproteobacteria bacterium]|nr:hypothetical protein [Deltaproteobacteria bacterium]
MKRKQESITIETPEHFELHFELAGIGARFLAFLIDRLIQLGLILALILIVAVVFLLVWRSRAHIDLITPLTAHLRHWILAAVVLVYG